MLGLAEAHIYPHNAMLLLRADLQEGKPYRAYYELSFLCTDIDSIRALHRYGLNEMEVLGLVMDVNRVLWLHTYRSRLWFRVPPILLLLLAIVFIFSPLSSSSGGSFSSFLNAVLVLTGCLLVSTCLSWHLARKDAEARRAVHFYLESELNQHWLPRGLCWRLTAYQQASGFVYSAEATKVFLGLYTSNAGLNALQQRQQQQQQQQVPVDPGAAGWSVIAIPSSADGRGAGALPQATYYLPPGPAVLNLGEVEEESGPRPVLGGGGGSGGSSSSRGQPSSSHYAGGGTLALRSYSDKV